MLNIKYTNIYTKRTMTVPSLLLLHRALLRIKLKRLLVRQPTINQRYLNGNLLSFQMINGLCLSRKTSGSSIPIERVDLTMRENGSKYSLMPKLLIAWKIFKGLVCECNWNLNGFVLRFCLLRSEWKWCGRSRHFWVSLIAINLWMQVSFQLSF